MEHVLKGCVYKEKWGAVYVGGFVSYTSDLYSMETLFGEFLEGTHVN